MSTNAMKLCSMILQEHFGENVRIVGDDLFASKAKTVNGIMLSTKLSRKKVNKRKYFEIIVQLNEFI